MRVVPLVLALLLVAGSASATEIREFSVPTLERMGNELIRASQRPDRGATDPVRKRARETGIAATKGRLFEVRYDYVVLDDPDGKGFLVYALALIDTKRFIQSGGDFRVTVSADGGTAERVDLLAAFAQQRLKKGDELAALVCSQTTSNVPVETWLYTGHVCRVPIELVMSDGSFWRIENGRMRKRTKAEIDAVEAKSQKK